MRDWTVHLLRGHILQYVNRLRIYVSSLPDSEPEVYARLTGPEGVKTAAKIADIVLVELGHLPPDTESKTHDDRRSVRAARKAIS